MAESDPQTTEPTEATRDRKEPAFRVEDKRHWAQQAHEEAGESEQEEAASTVPTVVDEYRQRAKAAEKKLLDYISAFKQAQAEQEQFRERLAKDVDRRVALQFGGLVTDLLECLDDLDLALAHASDSAEAAPLAQGVALARDRFLAALKRQGVERFDLDGQDFDPNVAEAVRVDPTKKPEQDGKVTETLRPGYRLGDRIVRPARVAVGRHEG